MSKRSFNDIEQDIKNAMEAHEPAFKEASWKKMEALLDKGEHRKRPFIFWLWLIIPLLITTGGLGYYAYNKNDDQPQKIASETKFNKAGEHVKTNNGPDINGAGNTMQTVTVDSKDIKPLDENNADKNNRTAADRNAVPPSSSRTAVDNKIPAKDIKSFGEDKGAANNLTAVDRNAVPRSTKRTIQVTANKKVPPNKEEALSAKNKITDKVNGKMKASITAASAEESDDDTVPGEVAPAKSVTGRLTAKQEEDVVVVKISTDTKDEKEIEKIVDSVIKRSVNDKKDKTKNTRFFILVAGGAEASGTKLFATDKITGRAGLAAGYNITKNLSVQAGFFVSNKKYKADGSSYKAKPGSYWTMVDIDQIDANCKVYEIPLQVNYNFTPGKKLSVFASAGISSYIMKKEDYSFYYSRYGYAHKVDANYSGNKSLFSVLRISGGVEKKVGKQFAVFASPGISIPLAGVGEGEVKLYSTEILIGLKFTPQRKNK